MRLSRLYPTYVPINGFYAPLYKSFTILLFAKQFAKILNNAHGGAMINDLLEFR